jgi:hypothetical protein
MFTAYIPTAFTTPPCSISSLTAIKTKGKEKLSNVRHAI